MQRTSCSESGGRARTLAERTVWRAGTSTTLESSPRLTQSSHVQLKEPKRAEAMLNLSDTNVDLRSIMS